MRTPAGILITTGLGALAVAAAVRHAGPIAGASSLVAIVWLLAIALRWPAAVHAIGLGSSCTLCAVGIAVGVPLWISAFVVSATLYGWDLEMLDLRAAAHRMESIRRLSQRYAFRSLILAAGGLAATLLVELVQIRSSFLIAFVASCACLFLFLNVWRRVRTLMTQPPTEADRQADEPPA